MRITKTLVTDSLGFRLELAVRFGSYPGRGRHITHEDETGRVYADTRHIIEISDQLNASERIEVIAHEAFHLFYSIRSLITVDEETEATVFGQLVSRVHSIVDSAAPLPSPLVITL